MINRQNDDLVRRVLRTINDHKADLDTIVDPAAYWAIPNAAALTALDYAITNIPERVDSLEGMARAACYVLGGYAIYQINNHALIPLARNAFIQNLRRAPRRGNIRSWAKTAAILAASGIIALTPYFPNAVDDYQTDAANVMNALKRDAKLPVIGLSSAVPAAPAQLPNSFSEIVRLSPNYGGRMEDYRGVIIHSTRGKHPPGEELLLTVGYFMDPKSKASSHRLVGVRGENYKIVDEQYQAWHSGFLNPYYLGIELEQGNPNDEFSDKQYQIAARIVYDWSKKYGFPISRRTVLGHEETLQGQMDKKSDPGPKFDWNRLMGTIARIN